MHKTLMWGLGLLTLAGTVACGGSAGLSPISPSSVGPAVSSVGTTIRGTATGPVSAGSGGSAVSAGSVVSAVSAGPFAAVAPATSLKVCVVGTSFCTTVSGSGEFELKGDFSGDVRLHFFGGGTDVELTLYDVRRGESITVTVSLNGTSSTIRIESRKKNADKDNDSDDDSDDGTDDGDGKKITICHRTGSGRYNQIRISVSAEPAHRAHGDGMIGEKVPDDPSKVFGTNCAVAVDDGSNSKKNDKDKEKDKEKEKKSAV